MDINDVILQQHNEQRRMFAYLDEWPRNDKHGLAAIWERLAIMLEVHAEAEERFFYPALVKLGKGGGDADSMKEEVTDAIGDHNDLREAIATVRGAEVGSTDWWDGVIAANKANSTHMGEEERQDLTDFRQQADLQLRHDLALEFVRYEAQHWSDGVKPVDKDPEEYVADHR